MSTRGPRRRSRPRRRRPPAARRPPGRTPCGGAAGVEGRDPDQPVDAALRGEEPVCVLALGDEGGRLDAGLLPCEASSISTWKPRRSAQRRYMRRSISAQSWESVPPAPERTVTTASPASYSPLKRRASSRVGQPGLDRAELRLELRGELGSSSAASRQLVEIGRVGLERAEVFEPPLRARVLGGDLDARAPGRPRSPAPASRLRAALPRPRVRPGQR